MCAPVSTETEHCAHAPYYLVPSKLFRCILQFDAGATTSLLAEAEPKPGMELKRCIFLRCFAAEASMGAGLYGSSGSSAMGVVADGEAVLLSEDEW